MKNTTFSFVFSLVFLLQSAFAQEKLHVPELKDISKWDSYSNDDKQELATFYLFQSWAKDGLIGPQSGICIDYKKGNESAGIKPHVSFGVNEFYRTGGTQSDNSKVIQANLERVMGAFKTYLDNGCKDESCKKRKVTLNGYADAQRNTYKEDHDFAKRFRAQHGVDIKDYASKFPQGFKSTDLATMGLRTEINNDNLDAAAVDKNPELSKNGNTVLALRRAYRYAAAASKFTDNVVLNGQAALQGEDVRESDGKDAAGVKCQKRRQAVVDVEFVPPKMEGAKTAGELGLNLEVSPPEMLEDMTMSGAIQVMQAMDKLGLGDHSLSGNDLDKIDQVIDQVLKAQNITDPAIMKGCKNYGTRAFIMDSSRRMKGRHREMKQLLNQEGGLQNLLTKFRASKGQAFANSGHMTDLKAEIAADDGIVKLESKDHDLLDKEGYSTSVMDCFSSKEAVASTLATNPKMNKSLCQSPASYAKNNSLNLKFDSSHKGRHVIGCAGCGTGHAFEAGADGKRQPITIDRYYGIHPENANSDIDLTKHNPYERSEVESYILDMEELAKELREPASNKIATEKSKLHPTSIKEYGDFLFHNPFGVVSRSDLVGVDKALASMISEKGLKLLEKRNEFLERFNKSTFYKDQMYARLILNERRNKMMTSGQKRDLDYYEQVLAPGVSSQKKLKENPSSQLTFGGLKNVSYFVVENCNCQTSPVMDLIAAGKGVRKVTISSDPMKEVEKLTDPNNTCIFVPPIPASCEFKPSKDNMQTNSTESKPDKINWLDASGNSVMKTFDEVVKDIDNQNSALDEKLGGKGCVGKNYMERGNELMQKLACSGPSNLPSGDEKMDCGYETKKQ